MPTSGIDHVNVLTDDLEVSAAFYEAVLDLTRAESPGARMGMITAWMIDAQGHPVIHLVQRDPARSFGAGHEPGLSTNAVHHVAFRCQGFAETQVRLTALGIAYQVNDGMLGLRQIMAKDPNAINVEMSFSGD